MNEILKDLKILRIKEGFSQSQFAELLGMSVRTLQQYEVYRRKPSKTIESYFKVIINYPQVLEILKSNIQTSTNVSDDKKAELKTKKHKQDPDAYLKLANRIIGGTNG